jgi:hypothetical protein
MVVRNRSEQLLAANASGLLLLSSIILFSLPIAARSRLFTSDINHVDDPSTSAASSSIATRALLATSNFSSILDSSLHRRSVLKDTITGADEEDFLPRPTYKLKGSAPLLFTCPDGRKGLHIVHIRLLLGQTEARGALGTFRSARLLLFRDFSLPGLARQTIQNFLLYVSYDLRQDFPFLEASYDILKLRMSHGASYLYMPEKAWSYTRKAHFQLAYPRVRDLILENGLASAEELDSVEMYVTSRVDNDDAVHTDTVGLTQQEACSHLGSKESDRLFISYVEPKLFWLPDARHALGQLAYVLSDGVSPEEVRHQEHILKFKPILQSLGVDKTLMNCYIPLNCYTHQHFEPAFINYARNTTDCPWTWELAHNLKILRPKDGAVGALYSRTPGSWYNTINDRGYQYLDMDVEALTGCGIKLGELASTNLLLGMLYKEAPKAAALSATAAKGFGGIGSMYTKQKAMEQKAEQQAGDGDQNKDLTFSW